METLWNHVLLHGGHAAGVFLPEEYTEHLRSLLHERYRVSGRAWKHHGITGPGTVALFFAGDERSAAGMTGK